MAVCPGLHFALLPLFVIVSALEDLLPILRGQHLTVRPWIVLVFANESQIPGPLVECVASRFGLADMLGHCLNFGNKQDTQVMPSWEIVQMCLMNGQGILVGPAPPFGVRGGIDKF